MSTLDQSLQLRAAELMNAKPGEVTAADAIATALLERHGDDAQTIAFVAGTFMAKTMKHLVKKTYELSEEQCVLFEIGPVIGVETNLGPLLVRSEDATLGQVKEWANAGKKYHATQNLRFERMVERLDHLKDEPDELPWADARNMLTAAQAGAVPDGE